MFGSIHYKKNYILTPYNKIYFSFFSLKSMKKLFCLKRKLSPSLSLYLCNLKRIFYFKIFKKIFFNLLDPFTNIPPTLLLFAFFNDKKNQMINEKNDSNALQLKLKALSIKRHTLSSLKYKLFFFFSSFLIQYMFQNYNTHS